MLALVLGLVVSAGLYFAYLWPSVEPVDELAVAVTTPAAAADIPAKPITDDRPVIDAAKPTDAEDKP